MSAVGWPAAAVCSLLRNQQVSGNKRANKRPKGGEAAPVAVHWVAARVEDVAIESCATATVVSLAALEVRPQVPAHYPDDLFAV